MFFRGEEVPVGEAAEHVGGFVLRPSADVGGEGITSSE